MDTCLLIILGAGYVITRLFFPRLALVKNSLRPKGYESWCPGELCSAAPAPLSHPGLHLQEHSYCWFGQTQAHSQYQFPAKASAQVTLFISEHHLWPATDQACFSTWENLGKLYLQF